MVAGKHGKLFGSQDDSKDSYGRIDKEYEPPQALIDQESSQDRSQCRGDQQTINLPSTGWV